jgi:DNA-binding ferritin-like protein
MKFNRKHLEELKEGMDALAERRKMERDRLDERLGKRDRIDQEEISASHMGEEKYININDLVKDFARLIDGQRKEIDTLTEEKNMTRDQLLKDYARIIDEQRKEIEQLKESVDYYSSLADHLLRMHE